MTLQKKPRIKRLTNRAEFVLPTGEVALIDLDDFGLISDHHWTMHRHPQRGQEYGYPRTQIWMPTEKRCIRLKMHQMVMGSAPKGKCWDHINQRPLDNRKSNLRLATHGQNRFNCNSSIAGVTPYNYGKTKKWVAKIGVNGKQIHLGTFVHKDDAIKVRKEAEARYYGHFPRGG